MGRSGVALDEVGCLLQATGRGDVDAFAALYGRTASVVFGLLEHMTEDPAVAERAMVRVYVRVWRTAPVFDPAVMSGRAFLVEAVHREVDGRERRGHAVCADRGRRPTVIRVWGTRIQVRPWRRSSTSTDAGAPGH